MQKRAGAGQKNCSTGRTFVLKLLGIGDSGSRASHFVESVKTKSSLLLNGDKLENDIIFVQSVNRARTRKL